MKYLKIVSLASLFLCCTLSLIAKEPSQQIIKFGKQNELVINLNNGLFSMKVKGIEVVSEAAASFSSNGQKYSSKDYQKRKLLTNKKQDKLGQTTIYTLLSESRDVPTMRQYFTCYPDQEFILIQLEIEGQGITSNYMAPLITHKATLNKGTDVRTLFVPFDNDTFIKYNAKPLSEKLNKSAELGAIYDNESRNGFVLGSIDHANWKTGVESAGSGKTLHQLTLFGGFSDVSVTRDSMEHGSIKSDKILSPRMFIGYFSDWRDGMEQYAKITRKLSPPYHKAWKNATPVGWNSWGVIKEHLTYNKAVAVVDFFDKEIRAFRNSDGTAYIDLDSFWDNMVPGGFSGDFSKLKDFVNYCKERNLEPGVYWAPFTDWGFRDARDRKAEGSDYKFSEMWTKTRSGYHDLDGGRALDPTHPGTQKRIAYIIEKLKNCGFKMIKIDFLSHAAIESTHFYDSTITTGMQAYKTGMERLSDHLANSMLVYAAISPSMATAPYAHMRRIACDAWKSIEDTEYTLNSVNYGWWQTYLYDYIDGDHLVFEKENQGANRARLISGLITGPVILGDDYSTQAPWQEEVKQWLQLDAIKVLIKSGKAFRPIEGNTGEKTSRMFVRHEEDCIYLAIFNYQKEASQITVDANRIGLSANKKHVLTELLNNEQLTLDHQLTIAFKQEGAYIYRISNK